MHALCVDQRIQNLTYWKLVDLPEANGRVWNPVTYKNNLVLQDEGSPITKYLGRWGRMGMDNRSINQPSAQGYDSNMGRDVMPYVPDGDISSCFERLQDVGLSLGIIGS